MSSEISESISTNEGAGFGCVVGLLTGAIVSISAIVVPGVGPVIMAGPLLALLGLLTGVIIGAAAGAITGALAADVMRLNDLMG